MDRCSEVEHHTWRPGPVCSGAPEVGWGHFLIQLYIHHAGSSGLPLPVCLHLGTLAECLSTERLLWSLQQGTAKGTYQGERWHCPRLCSSSHHPENCLEKRVSFYRKARKTPMPGSGSRAHPLDHRHIHAWYWITGASMLGSGSQAGLPRPCDTVWSRV